MAKPRTLYDKIWDDHLVHEAEDGTALLYIDRHLVHEVTSPQAFEGLKLAGRRLWRVSANLATADHNVPTTDRSQGIDEGEHPPVLAHDVAGERLVCDRVGGRVAQRRDAPRVSRHGSTEQAEKAFRSELAKYAALVKKAGITPE